jgi:predicted nucleic acid-binding protein
MNGKRYFFDTNAIIALLKSHPQVTQLAHDADYIAISVISRLEFFSFSGVTQQDRSLFDLFMQRVDVVDLSMSNTDLLDDVSAIRVNSTLKLPDAIILASARSVDTILVTADAKLANHAEPSAILFKPL